MIIFLYGQDSFRSRLKLNELKDKYLKEVDKTGSGLKVLAGANATFAEIAESVGPSSLFSKRRLIIIEDIFLNKEADIFEKISQYFKKEPSGNIVIFRDSSLKTKKIRNTSVPLQLDAAGKEKPLNKKQTALFKLLSGQKYAYSFDRLNNTELAGWIKKQAAARGGKISARAAELLVGLAGADGWRLNNELDKLLNYRAASGGDIEIKDVQDLVRGSFSENIFALTDALSAKNRALAVKLLAEQVEAGLNDGYLLNMFARQFKILLRIRQALENGMSQRQIAGLLKLHPYVLQKGLTQARNFTMPSLKNILSRLIRIDYEVKSGRGDYLNGLNMLIAKL